MTGRMSGSSRYVQNPDGSYRRSAGSVMEGSAGDEPSGDDEAGVEGAEGYAGQTNDELRAELEARGLATSGNKAELVARLEEADAG